MSSLKLWALIASTGMMAYATARWEAWVFYQQKPLDKQILTMARVLVGLLLIVLMCPNLSAPKFGMTILMMMGTFAPVHRLTLNLTRLTKYRDRNRTLTWYHMGTGPYDLLTAWIPWPRIRFTALIGIEALLASAMFQQLAA